MEWFIIGLFGLIFGSFLNVLIIRIPKNESICFPASHCQSCLTPLHIWHNIPIFSYLFLRAKCGFCGTKISWSYPLIEFISMLLALAIYAQDGYIPTALALFITFALFLALAVIDFKTELAWDSLNFSLLFFALLYGVLLFINPLLSSLNGALNIALLALQGFLEHFKDATLIAGALTLLRFALSWLLKREAMGEGDIITVASIGAILGVEFAFFAIFVAAFFTMIALLLLGNRAKKIAFIPFLMLGTLVVYFFGESLELLLMQLQSIV